MQGQVAFPVGYIGTMPSFLSYFFFRIAYVLLEVASVFSLASQLSTT